MTHPRTATLLLWLLLSLTACPPSPPPPTPPPPAQAPWPKFHHDKLQTGRSQFSTSANTGALKWKFLTGGAVSSSPAIGGDGTIYVGSADGSLYAIRPDGTPRWKFPTGGPVSSSPALGPADVVYVGSADGSLYAVNADGTLAWTLALGSPVQASPAIADDGTIYIGSNNGTLFAVSPTGTKTWSLPMPTPGSITTTPAIGTDGTIYVGAQNPEFYAITPAGMLKWTFKRTGNPGTTSAAIAGDGTIYVGAQDHVLYALNPADGTIKWNIGTTNNIVASSPAIAADGTIYIGSTDQQLYAVAPAGTKKWAFGTLFAVFRASSPAIGSEGAVYAGAENGIVYALNPDSSTKWTFTTGGAVRSSPAIGADGTIYVGSDDHHLYALGSATAAGTCCGAQQIVMQTTGAESRVQIAGFTPFPFPAGAAITVDEGAADAGCRHESIVPSGGFTVPAFCIPSLGFTAQITGAGCAAGTARGSGAVWDGAAPAPDPNVTRVADTSDPDGGSCGKLGTGCTAAAGGAGFDAGGNINTTRGGSTVATGKLQARLDIPAHVRVWSPADNTCPDGDGVYNPATDSLVSDFDFILSATTGPTGTDFSDLNGDACRFAGSGPLHTRHCAHDPTLSCTTANQCGHCSVSTALFCGTGGGSCPGTESCLTGACVDGPLTGIPAAGPCCSVGQTATLVYTNAAFTAGSPIFDVLIAGRMRVAVTQCNAAPAALGSCTLTTSPCRD